MFPRHLGYEIVILTVICTVALFLFPTASGPYSAVHGPVTALLSFRVRLKRWLRMMLVGLRSLGHVLPRSFPALRTVRQKILPLQSDLRDQEQVAVLRC